jgi:cytochrome c556
MLLVALALAGACAAPKRPAPAPPPESAWLLRGSADERFERVAKHLRGFDVAMVETGYRYTELYWAGRDRNWGYAEYQLGKIETAIANGIERRPKRAASAAVLEGPVAEVRTAIARRDRGAFETAFATLTNACNACHRAERVEFVTVAVPAARGSPVAGGIGGASPR